MYDSGRKEWTSRYTTSADLERDRPEEPSLDYDFDRAEFLLSKAVTGPENAEAVYQMEKIAKASHPMACFAMGQLFEYGISVSKDKKLSRFWYEKAAELGVEEAKRKIANPPKPEKSKKALVAVIAVVIAAAIGVGAFIVFKKPFSDSSGSSSSASAPKGLVMPKGVALDKSENAEDYGKKINEIAQEYDSEDIKSGKEPANRIVFVFKGEGLDLSKFKIAVAATDGEMTVLQFKNKEDAEECYNYLKGVKGVEGLSMDSYQTMNDTGDFTKNAGVYTPITSPVSGYDYLSWGATAMGLDQYAHYLENVTTLKEEVIVAVIDTGVEPNAITEDRIIDGINVPYGGDGKMDVDDEVSHGTHVASTVLDCTQGLNIKVMPIGVFVDANGSKLIDSCTGIQFAIDNGADVINMSMGGDANSIQDFYVNKAIDAGITFVVAAGNGDPVTHIGVDTKDYSPAHNERCITVASVDSSGVKAKSSNYGTAVDVCASGVEVWNFVSSKVAPPIGVAALSGTSMASPHVAALAAMIKLEYDETPYVIERFVRHYVRPMGDDELYYGTGFPDASLLVEKEF